MTALLVSALFLAANAFFVAAEFALVASRRHRLERLAEGGSTAARAALRGTRELALMLAGAQLGITVCTLALGSLAKPAVADLLEPILTAVRVPETAAYPVAVLLAVSLVVFVHMVIGEMAPKSWAIAHPERSAVVLALPFRGFAWLTRPLLRLLNAMANGVVRMVGVEPQDELAQAHGPRELRALLENAREQGHLAEPEHRVLAGAIDLEETPLGDVVVPLEEAVAVDVGVTCGDAEEVSRDQGRSRVLVREGAATIGLVHVRDLVRSAPEAPVATVTEPVLHIEATLSLLETVSRMRADRAQLALVDGPHGPIGLVTMEDLLERVLGRFDDETDR